MPIVDELAWLAFYLPRQGVQRLARALPLVAVRDRLPHVLAERLRFGLYPARITEPASVECAPRHPEWGDPAALDPKRRIAFSGTPRASLLVVTYDNLALTRLCLASLQRAAGALPFEIIVVDNASRDATAAHLRAVAAEGLLPLRFVENESNRGFAAATNQAASLARGDVLVFLNNDTVVVPGWLERLVAHLDRDPSLGLVGPVTNACGNAAAEVGAPYRDLVEMAGFAEISVGDRDGPLDEIGMLTLFCAATPRRLFDEVGGLDERYRVGMFEDDDLCLAVRRRGRRLGLARDVFVHHFGGAAFSRLPPRDYLRIFWENRRRFERKWGERWQAR